MQEFYNKAIQRTVTPRIQRRLTAADFCVLWTKIE